MLNNLDVYTPRLGTILLFEGTDARKVIAQIKNITTFSSVTNVLMRGSEDLTSLYVSGPPSVLGGNVLRTGSIGAGGIPWGEYIYYLTAAYGTYSSSTFHWDVIVQPRNPDRWFNTDYWKDDYQPFLGEITMYGDDSKPFSFNIPGADFISVTGALQFLDSDVTSTYMSAGGAVASGSKLTSALFVSALVPGDYVYYFTATQKNGNIATWFAKITALPRYGTG